MVASLQKAAQSTIREGYRESLLKGEGKVRGETHDFLEWCLEMLWEGSASVSVDRFNELGFSVQWLCWRKDPAHGSTSKMKEEL